MALTLAVAGLSAQEKSMLLNVLKARAQLLESTWTIFWEAQEFPAEPEVLIFNPQKEEGIQWFNQYSSLSTILISVIPPMDTTPSKTPLYLRLPFKPQEVIDTLNIASKRIQAMLDGAMSLGDENYLEIIAPIAFTQQKIEFRGNPIFERAHPFAYLYYYINEHYKSIPLSQDLSHTYYRIDFQSQPLVWIFPLEQKVTSPYLLKELIALPTNTLDVFYCSGNAKTYSLLPLNFNNSTILPKSSLPNKAINNFQPWDNSLRESIFNYFWYAGTKSYKTSEVLPWFSLDGFLTLKGWPKYIPQEFYQPEFLRTMLLLAQGSFTFNELLTEHQLTRKEVAQTLNFLILSDLIEKQSVKLNYTKEIISTEDILFLKSLLNHLQIHKS